jgi:hypothetical protein
MHDPTDFTRKGLVWMEGDARDGAGVRPTPAALRFEAINQL